MLNLIKAELFSFIKRRNARLFLLGVILACAFFVAYVTTIIKNPLSPDQFFYPIYSYYYPISLLIVVFLVIFVFHDEYSNKTIKNSIFQGFNLWQIMIAKCVALVLILSLLLLIFSFIMTIGAFQVNSTIRDIHLLNIRILSSMPSLIVYCFLFEIFLFLNKTVIVGLFFAYSVDQLIKIPLLILSNQSKVFVSILKITPSFILQNIAITHNIILDLLVSFCIVGLLVTLSKYILTVKELPN